MVDLICACKQRCWHDADDVPPQGDHFDPLMRPLQRGEVGVSFLPSNIREILPESELELVDRVFQPGDLCKRSIDDVRSGVVTNVDVCGRLAHAISGQAVEGWKVMADVYSTLECELGDYVAYNEWIGQVRGSDILNLCKSSDRSTGG
jgi:ubiquitin-conjugating enzyme E2 O